VGSRGRCELAIAPQAWGGAGEQGKINPDSEGKTVMLCSWEDKEEGKTAFRVSPLEQAVSPLPAGEVRVGF
jgi:hypothetical protein